MFNKKVYFPDFKIKDLIIEATMWKGPLKINKLKEKQAIFEDNGFKFLLVVSKSVEKHYINQGLNVTTNIGSILPNS